jgi:hypothetical protein
MRVPLVQRGSPGKVAKLRAGPLAEVDLVERLGRRDLQLVRLGDDRAPFPSSARRGLE